MFQIINIGPFAIQASGFILMLSLIIGLWLTGRLAEKIGANEEAIENTIFIGIVIGLIGARLGFFLQNTSLLTREPLSFFSLTPTMLDVNFGLLVGLISGLIFAQKKNLPVWPTLDALTPLFIFLFIGIHLADFANGNAYGLVTELPWGIYLWNEIRHPVQIYAMILSGLLFIGLTIKTHGFVKTGFMHSGVLSSITIASFGLITLFIRAFVAEKHLIGKIDLGQLAGLILLILSLLVIYTKMYRNQKNIPVILSLGSNINPQDNLLTAINKLKSEFKIRQISSPYWTQDVNSQHEVPDYLNQVLVLNVDLPFQKLREKLKMIEKELGRKGGNASEIPLDLDIITFGSDVFIHKGKQIPDPDLIKYNYIAVPIAEIIPDFLHPANGKSINVIVSALKDKSDIHIAKEVENGFEA